MHLISLTKITAYSDSSGSCLASFFLKDTLHSLCLAIFREKIYLVDVFSRRFLKTFSQDFMTVLGYIAMIVLRTIAHLMQALKKPGFFQNLIGHASGNENISFYPLFMIHNDVTGHLIRHFSMDNHYKLS